VLVHRPAYDDWAFPKGKLKLSEKDEHGALREVKEETGLDCRLGPELPTTTYPVEGGLKAVRYWAMTVEASATRPESRPHPGPDGASEVDEAVWLPLDLARRHLSYPRDVVVLDSLAQLVPLARESEVGR
jgi:8-oxo-dGTP pyrophosphatase MutT (NUDIX family)